MTKLSANSYLQDIEGIQDEFALIGFAVKECRISKLREFNGRLLAGKKGRFKDGLSKWKHKYSEAELSDAVEFGEKLIASDWRKKNRVRDLRFKIEFLEERLKQGELLLLVAYFESFLKVIHKQFLEAAPGIVLSKGEAEIRVKSLFASKTADFRPDLWLRGAVHKEVKALDREGIKEKADYFQKHFKVSFGTQEDLLTLEEIMNRRNKVSHEIFRREEEKPDLASEPERVSELPVLPDDLLRDARRMFRDIPSRCISVGAKHYPAHFKS